MTSAVGWRMWSGRSPAICRRARRRRWSCTTGTSSSNAPSSPSLQRTRSRVTSCAAVSDMAPQVLTGFLVILRLLPGVAVPFLVRLSVTCELRPGFCASLSHARDLTGGRDGMTALHKVLLHLSVAGGALSATPAVAGPVRPQVWVLLRNDAKSGAEAGGQCKGRTRKALCIDRRRPHLGHRTHRLRKDTCTSSVSSPRNLLGGLFPNPRWAIPRRDQGIGAFWPMCSCGGSSERRRDSKPESTSSLRCRLATNSVTCSCLTDLTRRVA